MSHPDHGIESRLRQQVPPLPAGDPERTRRIMTAIARAPDSSSRPSDSRWSVVGVALAAGMMVAASGAWWLIPTRNELDSHITKGIVTNEQAHIDPSQQVFTIPVRVPALPLTWSSVQPIPSEITARGRSLWDVVSHLMRSGSTQAP